MNTARTRRAQRTDVPHDDIEEAKIRRQKGEYATMPFRTHQRTAPELGYWERTGIRTWTLNGPIRVLLADDHTMFRQGLAGILASHGGLEVVAEVPNDAEALQAWPASSPPTWSSCRCRCPSRGPWRPWKRCAPSPTRPRS